MDLHIIKTLANLGVSAAFLAPLAAVVLAFMHNIFVRWEF